MNSDGTTINRAEQFKTIPLIKVKRSSKQPEFCIICGCLLHGKGIYASDTNESRARRSTHHLVAERFFGRSGNRPGDMRGRVFQKCPWGAEGSTTVLCYECHELLLHNPVFLDADLQVFAALVRARGLQEDSKTETRDKLAGRIQLLHEVIAAGLHAVSSTGQ